MKRKGIKKKPLIAIIALVLVAAIGAGLLLTGGGEPVPVYPFMYIGMTEYWGDSKECYGPVSTDKIQTVFLTQTQTVTKVLVEVGDTVKKGDVLLHFDTTLTDLSLERARLNVEKLKLQQREARDRLAQLNKLTPVDPTPTPTPDPNATPEPGMTLQEPWRVSQDPVYDGSTMELALICWMRQSTELDNEILEQLRHTSGQYRAMNTPAPTEEPTPTPVGTGLPDGPQTTEAPNPTEAPTPTSVGTGLPDGPQTTEAPNPTEAPTPTPVGTALPDGPQTTEAPSPTEEPTPIPEVPVEDFFLVLKTTDRDLLLGGTTLWQGLQVTGTADTGFRFKFFDASAVPDHTLIPEEPEEDPEEPEEPQEVYTSAELARLRSEQQKRINDLSFDIRVAETEYKIMQMEMGDGKVYAQVDGEVVSVLSPEEAGSTMQPIVKVSGGGGYYVEGTVSELEKDDLKIGQEVTVMDWNTGMSYTGTVKSVGDFPAGQEGWNGMGNPNASYYPFKAYVDGAADLQEGRYVNINYSTSGAENGIYLEKAFVRTEGGSSYVYIQGPDGRLQRQNVTTGKSLWGSYTQILEGLAETDLLAFPYGKDVKDGAPAVESDLSTLYGY